MRKPNIPDNLPVDVQRYLPQLLSALRDNLGKRLKGCYLVGSASYDDFREGESDLDVQIVTHESLTIDH